MILIPWHQIIFLTGEAYPTSYQENSVAKRHTLFYIGNTFISNTQLKLVKNQADAKWHSQAELWLFEIYSHYSGYHPKIIEHVLKSNQNNMCVSIHEIMRLIKMTTKMKKKNRSYRYYIKRPSSRHW